MRRSAQADGDGGLRKGVGVEALEAGVQGGHGDLTDYRNFMPE
jgi:hypothetical protein